LVLGFWGKTLDVIIRILDLARGLIDSHLGNFFLLRRRAAAAAEFFFNVRRRSSRINQNLTSHDIAIRFFCK